MVFEAVVVELLNKFLKQYVENLDTSQLKIGIWGGDVVLNDLKLRGAIFDDLNLPVRVKWGKLGKLAMKIPWKNLYTTQVVVHIEELLMVVIPNTEVVYDPIKEEKWASDKKQAKLKAVEDAKKRETEDDSTKPKDSFLEKLITQIIKNLQIVIRNIHIRYEDKTTIPGTPFSVGVTMSNLSAETTVKDPTSSFSKLMEQNTNFICKVVSLEGLAIYWNSGSVLYSELPGNELSNALLNTIPTAEFKPENFMYMFGPMSASVFLRINPKPEADKSNFTIPKVFVNVHLKEIELAITHNQFCDAMTFLQDLQRITAAAKYRKYRPVGIPVIGHAKEWWMFAYRGVVEDIVRRKTEWSWENIKEHRNMCRKYSELFKTKLNSKKITVDQGKEIKDLENKLNVFNLILLREQVYVEVERLNQENIKKKETKSGGWFSGWFGSASDVKMDSNDDELVKKIESVMTSHEKEKLYKAIGYEETAPPTNYPPSFVEFQFWFNLDEMKMTIYDDRVKQFTPVMTISIKSVKMEVEQRPSAFAMKLVVIVGKFQVTGKQNKDGEYPELVTSTCKESESLVELAFEKKPLNVNCDQLIHVNARPLKIIFDAETINFARDVFTSETSEEVEKFVAVTSASLPTFQKITSLGLQYAIEKRVVMLLKVNIMSSCIIIPYGGVYKEGKDMLVIKLGELNVETEETNPNVSVKKLHLEGTTDEEIFSAVLSASYTKFKCHLTGVQVSVGPYNSSPLFLTILFQLSGEDWVAASNTQRHSPMRFLESTNLEVTIKKSLVLDDARIPKMIIEGKLPSLAFNFSEDRFVSLVALACSIPTRADKVNTLSKKGASASLWSIQSLGAQLETKLLTKQKEVNAKPTEYVQGIDLVVHFEMNELLVNVSKTLLPRDKKVKEVKPGVTEEQFLYLRLVSLEVEFTNKTFEDINLLKLGGIDFKQYHKKVMMQFVSTKESETQKYLFVAEYIHLDTRVPDFYTEKNAIVNRLSLNIGPVNVLLDKEALLAQLEFVTNVQRRVDSVRESFHGRLADTERLKDIYEDGQEASGDKKMIAKGKTFRTKRHQKEVIDFFLDASLDEIDVIVEYEGQGVAKFSLIGASVATATKKSYMTVDLNIMEVYLLDLNPYSFHKKIVGSLEKQTLSSRVTLYNKEYFGSENSVDMSVDAEVGGLQCTYLTSFSARAFAFMNAFQTQIKTLKEGATVAAQKAKQNMIKAYQNAAQICLNIKITAPLLIVPSSSVGLETLVFDLGKITIKNSITELDYTSEGEVFGRPLIDVMKLNLHDLKIYRATLQDETFESITETNFLVPVTFELTLKRNLSRGWFRVIPELEVVARLGAVHVTLTHEDLSATRSIFEENYLEGGAPVKHSKTHSEAKSEHSKEEKQKKNQNVFAIPNASEIEELEKEGSHTYYTVVKFMFFMDSFTFDALTENCSQDPDAKNVGLARFVLEAMSLKGRLYSDNSIYAAVMLVSCLLDDTRPGKKGRLTRFMERTADPNEVNTDANSTNSMIELIYQKKDEDCFVDVRVFKFTLILSMDFLHKLGLFFMVEGNSSKRAEAMENMKHGTVKMDKRLSKVEVDAERPPTFTVNIRLEKPDIVIVENMDSVNTDALVFNTELMMKYRIAGFRQVVSGTLNDIQLYSCCFNPSKRFQTQSQVIKTFSVSIAGSTPEGSGLHIDICVTDIVITINPNTVDLITKCWEALLKDSTCSDASAVEADYSDLWKIKSFDPDEYWFLRPEEGLDVLSTSSSMSSFSKSETSLNDQICLLAIPSIKIYFDGSSAVHAQPLLMLDMGFRMQCYNWSQKLNILNCLSLEMKYYNKKLAAWEPIIEPNEHYSEQSKRCSYKPWELYCTVVQGDEGEIENLNPPKLQVTVSCTEILQLTVTKTGLEVLKTAADKLTTAVTKRYVKKHVEKSPYVVKNETGFVAELLLEVSKLVVCKATDTDYKIVRLEGNSEVELQDNDAMKSDFGDRNVNVSEEIKLFVKFPMANDTVFELPLGVSSKRYFPFTMADSNQDETWGLVSDVTIFESTTTIILRSILQVVNYFKEPIHIHSLSEDETVAEYVGTVEGDSSLSLPFRAVYNEKRQFFFSVTGYSLSTQPFEWEDISDEMNIPVLLQCPSKDPETLDPFFIQALGQVEKIYYGNTNRKTSASLTYKIHLGPSMKIFNALPVPLILCFQGTAAESHLNPGNMFQVTSAEPGRSTVTLRISDYLEKEWSCKEVFVENPPEFLIWKFTSYNGLAAETLNFGVHVKEKRSVSIYTVYCPYLMVNKTEHLLAYKFDSASTVFYHPKDLNMPVMFSPSTKRFYSKKSANLQVDQSSWSDKFPVDVAGSGGTVECHDCHTGIIYKISVTITLSSNALTKIVVFTPFYVFINSMGNPLEYQELDLPDNSWVEIPQNSCVPFWPVSRSPKRTIQIRPKDSDAISPPFDFESTDTCLLRLSHKIGGIFVVVRATQSGNYITFSAYEPGQAPALIVNHSAKVLQIYEHNTSYSVTLKPLQEVMHAWVHPTGSRELMVVSPKHHKPVIPLNQDTDGLVLTSKGEKVRYVAFLNGTQRVLLFTDDHTISRSISSAKPISAGIEVICKIQGIGLSLVNNITRLEVFYLAFMSSGICWESRKLGKSRFKRMKEADIAILEAAYDKYLSDKEMDVPTESLLDISDNRQVDLEKLEIIKPVHRELRRTFEPGLWLAYRVIEDQIMLHIKINRIQMDSQIHDSVFPVVLSPVPPPKTVANNVNGPKPFLELSLVKITADRSGVEQYKYFKVLVQEFEVQLDITFIQKMYQFFAAEEASDEDERNNFKKDLDYTQKQLISYVQIVTSNEQKHFYDLLHFSPLKIHFSFSLAGKIEMESLPPSLSVMLQSVGVTLTDVHDVLFRLSYFERRAVFFTNSQLLSEVTSHYYGQTIRQAYVLLLGLDVIGNPFGLIVGIGEGVEAFFYEPFQGMIQGPSEFGAGMAIGCKSLFGHTVGSAAGTLGKLTDTLGKGLAVLSLDKEYQLQRMQDRGRSENFQASMARGGRGLVMGVYEGVTGVVTKPLKGAKEEGVGGFFKGMGKGMMGLMTRPMSGVVDFASTSFNAVKRATESNAGTKRVRPPRYFRDDCLVEPYNLEDAQGSSIFYSICKRKYCSTDKYEYNLPLREKEIVILTNKRIILAEMSDVFGTWQEHMAIMWTSMPDRPRCHTKGVAICIPRKGDTAKFDAKVLLIPDKIEREAICKKMVELYTLEKEQHQDDT